MSEMGPEPGAGGNVLTRKYGGIPGWVFMAGAAVIVYFVFLRGKSGGTATSGGPSSSGGGGTSTTGDITFTPGTTTVQFTGPSANNNPPPTPNPVTNPSPPPVPVPPVGGTVGGPSQSGNPNPQPAPKPPIRQKHTHIPVDIPKRKPARVPVSGEVTVAKWPGKSSGGLAQWNTTLWGIAKHQNTTVANLLKLNPNIKNASLLFPGEKVKVPSSGKPPAKHTILPPLKKKK